MVDLSTEYLGLKLKNPIIIGSCGLTNSVEKIKKLEEAGAGAIVIKSLFEEEILNKISDMTQGGDSGSKHFEGEDYLDYYVRQHNVEKYLTMIRECKANVSIPVIASVNCVSPDSWISFAKKIEEAGADALELNIFIMPADVHTCGIDIEKLYFEIAQKTMEQVSIPVSLKVGNYFSGLAQLLQKLSQTGIAGLVLFNRFFSPDIDIEDLSIVNGDIFSRPEEISTPLRWIALMSDHAECDLAATTGIHDGEGVIKNILAGASAVQIASTIYKNGYNQIRQMLAEIEAWMDNKNYASLQDFRGKMSSRHIKNPVMYERGQFMKYFSNAKV